MSVVSIGNIHAALIDKTVDPSNRTQPICLIPLKTVKEDLTYLSGSVNSQMLLDNLSGESICQLAIDHLTAVLEQLKSTPPVNLKVVFSSVKAVVSPPLPKDHQDLESSDSQEILLDETTHFAENPFDVTTNHWEGRPSAIEVAVRQMLDEEIKFLPNDTLESLTGENGCSELTDQTGACLDSLADPNSFESHSSTLPLVSLTESGSLENQEEKHHSQTDSSDLQPVSENAGRSEILGCEFTYPYHSHTVSVVTTDPDFGASEQSEISGAEIQMEDRSSRTENRISLNGNEADNSPKIYVENTSVIEYIKNWTENLSRCQPLTVASTSQIHNPCEDSTLGKSKKKVGNNCSSYSKRKASHTRIKGKASDTLKKVGNPMVKGIKRGEKCRCIKCGHFSICYANLLKHTVECHMKTVPCKCTDCDEEIRSAIAFQYHQLKHTEATQKDKDTLNRLAFTVGKKATDSEKNCPCEICGKTYINKKCLLIHQKIHSGEKPYHCADCDSKFLHKSALNAHVKTHSGDRRFSCTLCPKTFRRVFSLRQHMLEHTAEKIYSCWVCYVKFPTEELMRQHVSGHESREVSGVGAYKCDICDRSFVLSSKLSAHKRRVHSTEMQCVCCKCGEHFTIRSKRQKHFCNTCNISADKKMLTCHICKKVFKKLTKLRLHFQCHSSDKDYLCSVCGKTFKQMSYYSHIRTHASHTISDLVPSCTVCGKGFKSLAGLKSHERFHSAEDKSAVQKIE